MPADPTYPWMSEACVEAVARALATAQGCLAIDEPMSDEDDAPAWKAWDYDARAALRAAGPFIERWADEATYGAYELPHAGQPLAHCERFNAGVLSAREALGLTTPPAGERE